MNRNSRWRSLRNRLALIAAGVLLGLAARWLVPPGVNANGNELFVPMPAASDQAETSTQ